MERDILRLRQELDAIEEQYMVQSKVASLEASLARERTNVQDLEDKLAGIRRLLGLPPDDDAPDADEKSASSTSSVNGELDEDGPKKRSSPTPQRPFVCPQCGDDYSARQYLVRHQNLTGHGGSPYTCPQCHEGFTTQGHLARHLTKEEHQ
jgi:predicted RNA-binding Zn-ribbon protein involved in translation (DUF1610 family)